MVTVSISVVMPSIDGHFSGSFFTLTSASAFGSSSLRRLNLIEFSTSLLMSG
jgi:hypothetical protein